MNPFSKRALLPIAVSLFVFPCVYAGSPATDVYPKPHIYKISGGAGVDAGKLAASSISKNPELKKVLPRTLKAKKIRATGTIPIVVEKDGTKVERELAKRNAKNVPEAYVLKVTPAKIEIFAKDDAGVFYAAQTLARMIEADGKIAVCDIADWPDVAHRGSVEGYYGRPWTPDARLRQFDFYGKYKINTYIYGPKDDPYHHARWWEPYPKETAELLKKQIQAAHDNHVDFVWAAHVGSIITNPANAQENMRKLVEKFEIMYDLGVRSFGVFFDDIFTHNAELQSDVCNYVVEHFLSKKNDVTPLVMCPSQYNRGWSGGDYLDILGNRLHPSIRVMWTGDSVCTDITEGTVDWISKRIKREPYIWWNWPVVDYCASSLLLGRTYGLAKENRDKYSGFVSNPMDKPEASKIALFGVGDYCWNVDAFDSVPSWKYGIKTLFPKYADAMQTLANHSSDQGPNGHGYRREESVEFKPVIDKATAEYEKGKFSAATAKKMIAEFKEMRGASKELISLVPADNPELWEEIEFWVRTLGETGKFGDSVVKFVMTKDVKKRKAYAERAAKYYASRERTMEAQAAHADKIGAPHRNPSRVAARVVAPFLTKVFRDEWAKYCKQIGVKTSAPANDEDAPYKVISDVAQMKKDIPAREGKYVRIRKFEPITLAPKQYVGIGLPEGVYGDYVHVILENKDAAKNGALELSTDGVTWKRFDFKGKNNKGDELFVDLDPAKKIRFFRYVNTSNKSFSIKLKEFKFDVPEDAKVNSRAAIFDNDPTSYYTIENKTETFVSPGPAKDAVVLSDAPKCVTVSKEGGKVKVTVKPEKAGHVEVFEILWK
ncbi:MAG: beta-N-acetylglucosaminidase domain-containing protein [Opitutales bacterium]|nr:beta-N-acetylglucosaminidase domain-containing protein [Opitutales bacterium]